MTIVMSQGLAGPRSPPASPASTSQPLRGPGCRRGPPAHSVSSQGGRGRPDTHTHAQCTTRTGGSRACLRLPCCPTPPDLRTHHRHVASHPTPQHNPVSSIKAAAPRRTPLSLPSPLARGQDQTSVISSSSSASSVSPSPSSSSSDVTSASSACARHLGHEQVNK